METTCCFAHAAQDGRVSYQLSLSKTTACQCHPQTGLFTSQHTLLTIYRTIIMCAYCIAYTLRPNMFLLLLLYFNWKIQSASQKSLNVLNFYISHIKC